MRIAREEIFGPVLVVIPFDDDADAVAIANDSEFGLAGAVWSRDIQRARKVANQVRTGTMWINDVAVLSDFAPFGGYKSSGLGREFGEEGLKAYTNTKVVYHLERSDSSQPRHLRLGGDARPQTPGENFRFLPADQARQWARSRWPTSPTNCGCWVRKPRRDHHRHRPASRPASSTIVRRAAGERCVGVFDGVVPDPTYECAQAALELLPRRWAPTASSAWAAAARSMPPSSPWWRLTNGGSAMREHGPAAAVKASSCRTCAIPTTHGTGSEVTLGAVITNTQLHKQVLPRRRATSFPTWRSSIAVLVTGLPKAVTIGTGMDALTHAIEGLVTPGANPITTALRPAGDAS
jgi:aldehyde dehydrogenase (NAD+)